jgi:glutamate-1-semialdehyde 2,1-aminomutase
LREVCTSKEIVLVFDEIITGFRLAFGGAQEYYGVIPDLATFGKILGGGLPVGAIAGLEEIMELADTSARKEKTERCWIGGGTFSDNPMTMAAGLATLRFLGQNKNKVYEKLGTLGNLARDLIDASFKEEGFSAKTTGAGSLLYTHFLHEGQRRIDSASEAARANTQLEKDYYFSLIANNDIFFLPGHLGAISLEHTEEDVRTLALASRQFAERHEKLVQSVSPKLV